MTTSLSPYYMAALAVAAVPNLQIVSVSSQTVRVGNYSYVAVVSDDGRHWIVKYPHTAHAGTALEAEVGLSTALLEELRRGNLPFDVLRPSGYADVEHGRALIYLAPVGHTLALSDLTELQARELGRTLAAIHNLSADVVANAGLPVYDAQTWRERCTTELADLDNSHHLPLVLRRRWEQAFRDDELWQFTTTVVHGDVADENFLWSEGQVTNVLGFSEAHVGDPALDLAAVSAALTDERFDEFLSSYTNARSAAVDEHLPLRVALMSEFAVARWLMFGIRTEDDAIVADGMQMLEQLAADISADPELLPDPAWEIDLVSQADALTQAESADGASFSSREQSDFALHAAPDANSTSSPAHPSSVETAAIAVSAHSAS